VLGYEGAGRTAPRPTALLRNRATAGCRLHPPYSDRNPHAYPLAAYRAQSLNNFVAVGLPECDDFGTRQTNMAARESR